MKVFKYLVSFLVFINFTHCSATELKTTNKESVSSGITQKVNYKTPALELEAKKFKEKLFLSNIPLKYFYATFSIKGKVNKKKYNALGKLWVDNEKDRIKIIITDPVFESLINTMVIEGGTAHLYDHLRRENFSVPTEYLRVESFMGDRMSFSSLKPIIQNRLPAMLRSEKNCRFLPKEKRVYYSDPFLESVFDFQKNHLARIIVRDRKQKDNKILMILKKRRLIRGKSFPFYIGIKDESNRDFIELKFRWVQARKKFLSKIFRLPGK